GSRTPQSEARRQVVQDTNARTPGLLQGWVIPPHREPQHYALEIATLILAYGDSSVLHQRLVRKESLLRQVAAWTYDRRGPDLLVIRSLLTERADAERVEAIIAEELDRLATVGPTTEELARAVQQVRSMFLFG